MKKPCIICDVDGTVAIRHGRGPYEWSKVDSDLPNAPVIEVVRAMHACGFKIIFTSGRKEQCRDDTIGWLNLHIGTSDFQLLMRGNGDNRPDVELKREMLDLIVNFYIVACVFDDRQAVVDMWRANGLTCLQVNPGPEEDRNA